MFSALVGAPLAHFRADAAQLGRESALTAHGRNTVLADINALHTAFGAIVDAFHSRHLVSAPLACHDASLTRLDTAFELGHVFLSI